MELTNNRQYVLHLTNHTKLFNAFISFGVITIVLIAVLSLAVNAISQQYLPYLNTLVIAGVMVIMPLFLLLYYYRFLVKKVKVTISIQGIETNINRHFPFTDIKKIKKEINRKGHCFLCIVVLNNDEKYTFTPPKQYKRTATDDFTHFIDQLENALITAKGANFNQQ